MHGGGERGSVRGSDTAFAVFIVDIDLNAHLERRQVGGPLLTQAAGNFFSINGMHPVKVFGDVAGFVRLNGANEVPRERQITECLDFIQCFL